MTTGSSDPPLGMLGTLTFWILLLPGLLVNGKPPCGDKSVADVRHAFTKYNVGLVSLP